MENVATPRLPIGSADDAMASPNNSIPLQFYVLHFYSTLIFYVSFAVCLTDFAVLFHVRLFLLALLILRGSMRPGLVCMFPD